MKRFLYIVASAVLSAGLSACTADRPAGGFAIVTDSLSYSKCTESLDSYCRSVRDSGLDAFVCAETWANPEQVKDSLLKWYGSRNLEGAVFVGDIPIPMIRQAQFLTSAFKMDENGSWEWRDCSVPSDRFYDDFDLKFDFLKRDSLETNFFYYNLAADGSQKIECDIYTGRIKPSEAWGDKYEELDRYLRKLVSVRAEMGNKLDHIASYTGEGSFSNSMIAWKDEQKTLQEQVPLAFKNADGARFSTFYQAPTMGKTLLEQASLDEMDLFLFHCHGTPERQWIGGYIDADQFSPEEPAETWDEMTANYYKSLYGLVKYQARSAYRRYVKYYGKADARRKMYSTYGIDESFYGDALRPEVQKADSLLELTTGIVLSDVHSANPNTRIALFDACYNGDFREDDFIANRYIMGSGKCVVGLGNSVNVLQDKAASPLLGMLSAGYSVGEWQQQVNILESHVIGDPSFRFESSCSFKRPDLRNTSVCYWKKFLNSKKYPADINALALQKLVSLGYSRAPRLLRDTYFKSDSYCVRFHAMMLLLEYDAPQTREVLVAALDDPYEFTRRKAAYFLSLRGEQSTAPELAKAYMRDYNAKRVQFNILGNSACFGPDVLKNALMCEIDNQGFVYDTAAFKATVLSGVESAKGIAEYAIDCFTDKTAKPARRTDRIKFLRNNPYPFIADDVIGILIDSEEPQELRLACAEALGWYTYAWNKSHIAARLEDALAQISDEKVASETLKTINRLKAYIR